MKLKTKIRIAYDMCIKRLFSFRISILLMSITFILSGFIVYQYNASFGYRLRVSEAFSVPLDSVYHMITSSDSEETYRDFRNIEGISDIYHVQMSYNTSECLYFLNQIQKGHKYEEDTEGIEEIWLFARDFDMFNVSLTEGTEPSELDWSAGRPLYLSERYKDITELGGHYIDKNPSTGEVLCDYYVAGYFSDDSVIAARDVTSSGVQDGVYSLKYEIIELGGNSMFDGYFTISEGYSFDDFKEQVQEILARSNADCIVTNVAQSISHMEKNIVKALRYLIVSAILLCGTSIIVLLVNQVGDVLTRSDEYGIWLTNKATHKDILWILAWQNIIRLIYSELFAVAGINLLIRLVMFGENFENTDMSHRISERIIAFNVYPAMIGIGIFIAAVSAIAPLVRLAHTEPVKLIKGEM